MDAIATADFYELVVARQHKASTVLTSNRDPDERLAIMTDPLLAPSVVDRLTSTAHELILEGQSYRRRQKPSVDTAPKTPDHAPRAEQVVPTLANRRSHHLGE